MENTRKPRLIKVRTWRKVGTMRKQLESQQAPRWATMGESIERLYENIYIARTSNVRRTPEDAYMSGQKKAVRAARAGKRTQRMKWSSRFL